MSPRHASLLGLVLVATVAAATTVGIAAAQAQECPPLQGAVGLSLGWQSRQDYGERTRSNFVPELVGMLYAPLVVERLYLRPAVRLGYSGLQQATMPMDVTFREDDVTLTGEVALVRDGFVVPSLAVGGGLALRRVDVETDGAIGNPGDALDDRDLLPLLYSQAGVGISLTHGRLIVEPYVRYEWMLDDPRLGWGFGADVTWQIF